MKTNCCRRCCLTGSARGGYHSHKIIGGKWPEVLPASHPSMIQWGNLGVSTIQRVARSLLTYLIGFIIICCSFLVIVKLLYYRDDQVNISGIECGQIVVTKE